MAKPTKLTDETRDRIALLIRAGNTVDVAAQAAGIGRSTFFEWMEQGEAAKTGALRDFYEAIETARAESEASHIARISQAARNGSWQAAAWLMERRFPARWIKATDRKHLANPEGEVETPVDPFEALDEFTQHRVARQNGA